MKNRKFDDLRFANLIQSSTDAEGDFQRAVREQLVTEGIFPSADRIPEGLINFVIESWRQVYETGYTDGRVAEYFREL